MGQSIRKVFYCVCYFDDTESYLKLDPVVSFDNEGICNAGFRVLPELALYSSFFRGLTSAILFDHITEARYFKHVLNRLVSDDFVVVRFIVNGSFVRVKVMDSNIPFFDCNLLTLQKKYGLSINNELFV